MIVISCLEETGFRLIEGILRSVILSEIIMIDIRNKNRLNKFGKSCICYRKSTDINFKVIPRVIKEAYV